MPLAVIVTASVLFSACGGGGSPSSSPVASATGIATPSLPSVSPAIGKWTASFGASDPEFPVFYTVSVADGSSFTIAPPVTFPSVPQSVTLIASQTGATGLPTSVVIAAACGNVVTADTPSPGNPGSVVVTASAAIPANCTVVLRGAYGAYAGNGAQFVLR